MGLSEVLCVALLTYVAVVIIVIVAGWRHKNDVQTNVVELSVTREGTGSSSTSNNATSKEDQTVNVFDLICLCKKFWQNKIRKARRKCPFPAIFLFSSFLFSCYQLVFSIKLLTAGFEPGPSDARRDHSATSKILH